MLDFFEHAENAFLLFKTEIFSPKVKERKQYPVKVYCIDNGFVNFINPRFSENFGSLMENSVAIELWRRKENTTIPTEIYYWKDENGKEVDFVIKQGSRVKQLIQVTYALGRDDVDKREIKALLKASELLKCKNLLVITWDYEGEEKIKNKKIKFMPLWKWLLSRDDSVVLKTKTANFLKKFVIIITMNTEELKKIITSQREEIEEKFEKIKIIKREVEYKKLLSFLSAPNILAVLGLRRCGKSILSLQIFKQENFGYINFDDERLAEFKVKDFEKLLNAFYELYGEIDKIILDEPQNIEKWELFANRLRRTKKIIVTGSNSRLLSGELASALTGRHITFTLFPFSFREYLSYNDFEFKKQDIYSTKKIALLKKHLTDFLNIGGIPEAYLFGKEILVRIYADIIEKDVIKRLKTKKKAALKELAKYLVSNFASEFTFAKLKNILKIKDQHTVKNWISALEDAYLFAILERYSPKLKEQIIAPKKVYCVDNGIINVVSFKLSQNFGKLMENLVAIELLRGKILYPLLAEECF